MWIIAIHNVDDELGQNVYQSILVLLCIYCCLYDLCAIPLHEFPLVYYLSNSFWTTRSHSRIQFGSASAVRHQFPRRFGQNTRYSLYFWLLIPKGSIHRTHLTLYGHRLTAEMRANKHENRQLIKFSSENCIHCSLIKSTSFFITLANNRKPFIMRKTFSFWVSLS